MMEQINARSYLSRSFARYAVESKIAKLRQTGDCTHKIYDKLIFNKIQQAFGGNIKLIISAGAPLRSEISEFLSIAVICPVIQAHGMSETGVTLIMYPGDQKQGHCGGPTHNYEVKLDDAPEMNYTHNDQPFPRGELCFRTKPSTFLGYYKDKEGTNALIDQEQWIHSGDIAELTGDRSFKIIDRKKNIFKLAQGEYICAEQLENLYSQAEGVREIYVHGDSFSYYLFGVIVPVKKHVEMIAKELNIQTDDWLQLCDNEKIKERYLQDLEKFAKSKGLNSLQVVKKIYFEPNSFEANKLQTTSFKLKRYEARKFYSEIFKKYYI